MTEQTTSFRVVVAHVDSRQIQRTSPLCNRIALLTPPLHRRGICRFRRRGSGER